MSNGNLKFIFAGGGTGGHLYPAIAVAEELKLLSPNSKIVFVGTNNKIESRVVPQMGFDFKSIWISGFTRKLTVKNLMFPIKLVVSIVQSFFINLSFKANVAVGVGAYVSGPIIWIASLFGSKVVLLEQNSFPGVTNRMLENKADRIHLSFEDSMKYFKNKSKLKLTGNPVRTNLKLSDKENALKEFGLDPTRKTLLILGGSLGARSINNAIAKIANQLIKNNIQIIWQTGELYFEEFKSLANDSIKIMPFISEMQKAYSACDLLVARAGATTIAEVAYLGLPVIFVPSTNVAANHQFKNAKSLVDKNAGLLIEDSNLEKDLYKLIFETANNEDLLNKLSKNIKEFSKPLAANQIAKDILELAEKK